MPFDVGHKAIRDIAAWAAEQMGIDPDEVTRVSVDLNCNAVVKAQVTVAWREPMVRGFRDRLSRYTLTPLEGGEDDEAH